MPDSAGQQNRKRMRCLECGYRLIHLTENRCPECGRAFDPNDPESFLSKRVSGTLYLIAAILPAICVSFPLVIALIIDRTAAGGPIAADKLGFLAFIGPICIIGGTVGAIAISSAAWYELKTTGATEQRGRLRAAFLISSSVWLIMCGLVLYGLLF